MVEIVRGFVDEVVFLRLLYCTLVLLVILCRGACKYNLRTQSSDDPFFGWLFTYWLVSVLWWFYGLVDFGCSLGSSNVWTLFWRFWFVPDCVGFLLGLAVAFPLFIFLLVVFVDWVLKPDDSGCDSK